jgi:hypothetical protein
VIRWKFDGAVQDQAARHDDRRHIANLHSHFRFWPARLPEHRRFLARPTMPIDDPELPAGLEDCRNGARQPALIRDPVKGVGEENVIDRLRHDPIDPHGVRHGETAVGRPRRRNPRPRAVEQVRVDVDGLDAPRYTGEGNREQPVAATEIDCGGTRRHAHLDENLYGVRPQRLPPVGIGHCCCRKKTDDHAVLTRALGRYAVAASSSINHSHD